MPAYIRLMDVGLFFIRVCFSKRGSAATKLGEFLACGVPVIINDGVGDSGDIVRSHRVGVVLSDTSPGEFERAYHEAHKLLAEPDVATRCREVAVRYFDVDAGARRYLELYRTLTGSLARSVADHA
jgi:glycosyltransferase involved in cell wall biosynthesis